MPITVGETLTLDEEKWLRPYNWDLKDITRLSGEDRKILFIRIWNKDETSGTCRTCHAREGYCEEAACIRLRVTHKLGLQSDWRS